MGVSDSNGGDSISDFDGRRSWTVKIGLWRKIGFRDGSGGSLLRLAFGFGVVVSHQGGRFDGR